MNENPDHLSEEEVAQVLELVKESNAVVVGGQSMALWARHYSEYNPEIAKIYTMSSEDVDFYGTRRTAEDFAAKLGSAKIYFPDADDHGPNSAQVIGFVGERKIRVDFLHSIMGVDHARLENNVITLTGPRTDNGASLTIALLHPLDCFRSRLSNINDLKRSDVHSISTAKASILVLDALIDDFLSMGWLKEAQDTLHTLGYVTLKRCYGTTAHLKYGIDPLWIFEKYLTDTRLDERWRKHQLAGSLSRLKRKLTQIEAAEPQKSAGASSP
ncbi:hypothetical protein [Bradyrhizobium sp. SZCCHNRI1009]|uniref:hypothetical protein n=1 Tax=Bradyrhizobium sp. SZCCHNRI1009 TaxID=3057277 RepID=UPI002915F19F|nr:hypothetical protein [Bradyrhizobium sp. SZCCHNRI1009]